MYRVSHKRRPIAKKFKVDISHYFTFFIIIELIRNILNFWETGVFFGKPCMCIICPFLRISKKAKATSTKMKERKMRRRRRRVGGIKESIDSLGGMISWTTSVQGDSLHLSSFLEFLCHNKGMLTLDNNCISFDCDTTQSIHKLLFLFFANSQFKIQIFDKKSYLPRYSLPFYYPWKLQVILWDSKSSENWFYIFISMLVGSETSLWALMSVCHVGWSVGPLRI